MTESQVAERLRKYYAPPAWALLFGVRSCTGYGKSDNNSRVRTADALAMSLYPSRGLFLYGIEIKISRGDWLRELRDPDKAEEIARYCSGWIIAAPPDVVDVDELPPHWGLLMVNTECRMKKNPGHHPPDKNVDAPFLASLLRTVNTMSPSEQALAEARYQAAVDARRIAEEECGKENQHIIINQRREIEELKKAISDFEHQSGLCIRSWGGSRIGEDVAAFRRFMD